MLPNDVGHMYLNISNIDKNVSLDHTRHCIHTYNKKIKIYLRINSTVNVIRACMFIMLPVLQGTQRVPPTCTIKAFTYLSSSSDVTG
jgi:hypothetical protein